MLGDRSGKSDMANTGENTKLKSWMIEREYMNWAWGFRHTGKIIFSDGRVATYSNPGGNTHSGLNLSEALALTGNEVEKSLEKKLEKAKFEQRDNLDLLDLSMVSDFVNHVSKNGIELTDAVSTAFDAGSTTYKLYLNLDTGGNRIYEFSSSGDYTRIPKGNDELKLKIKKIIDWINKY